VAHTIEPAASGRAKCRGCGRPIAKGELRLGVRLPNPFDEENELTLWFHLRCGAYTRPAPYLEAANETQEVLEDRAGLEAAARLGLEHERLTRVRGVERARTARSSCRHCREAIGKDAWRLTLTFYDEEEGRFSPGGFLHLKCAREYFGTEALQDRIDYFTSDLDRADLAAIASEVAGAASPQDRDAP
jgi:Poly(ADP-ribose) polymerase and DNA-Ligase Zn-finger region